jgi:hypothetical protein
MPWREIPLTKEDIAAARRDEKKARLLVDERLGIGTAEVLRDLRWNVAIATEWALPAIPMKTFLLML